jgi:hypothetical protein
MIERAAVLNDCPQSGSVLAAGNDEDWAITAVSFLPILQ